MDKVLSNYFIDPKKGFQSAEKLYKKLKDDKYKYSLSAIKDWNNKQSVQQQFKQTKIIKKTIFRSFHLMINLLNYYKLIY